MTQEEKQLLLQDLCARLPYGVKATTTSNWWRDVYIVSGCNDDRIYLDCPVYDEGDDEWLIESVKPYLRPMSSMTEEERKEIGILIREKRPNPYGIINNEGVDNLLLSVSVTSTVLIDWLLSKHFDVRGLIPKGLAIEVTEENNPYERIDYKTW